MKIGGLIIGLLGAVLFLAHLFLAESHPEQFGYLSHQVRAVDGIIVMSFGIAVFAIGWARARRRRKAVRDDITNERNA